MQSPFFVKHLASFINDIPICLSVKIRKIPYVQWWLVSACFLIINISSKDGWITYNPIWISKVLTNHFNFAVHQNIFLKKYKTSLYIFLMSLSSSTILHTPVFTITINIVIYVSHSYNHDYNDHIYECTISIMVVISFVIPYRASSNQYPIIKGSLVRKLPRYWRFSWLASSPSWQPHHHVNNHRTT